MSLEKITPENTEYAMQTLRNRSDMISMYIYRLIDSFKNSKDNPIKNNRIVSDSTFAARLVSHLNETNSGCQIGQEEIEYLLGVAKKLLKYQKQTMPEDEKWYFKNIKEI